MGVKCLVRQAGKLTRWLQNGTMASKLLSARKKVGRRQSDDRAHSGRAQKFLSYLSLSLAVRSSDDPQSVDVSKLDITIVVF